MSKDDSQWSDIVLTQVKRLDPLKFSKLQLVLFGICLYIFLGLHHKTNKAHEPKIFHVTPKSRDDNILLLEYMSRKKRVREVCEKYGAYTSKMKYLSTRRKMYKDEGMQPKEMQNRLDEDGGIWASVKTSNRNQFIIQKKYHLGWCKVPKAASTSWSWIYLKLANVDEAKIEASSRQHALLREFYPPQEDIPKKMLSTYLKFMVVRHPFERLLSAYRDKLEDFDRDVEMRDGYYSVFYGKDIIKKFRKKDDNPELSKRKSPTFIEFVQYLINSDAKTFDEHWKPVSYLCSPCHTVFDIISKMETLVSDMEFIFGQTKVNLVLPWAHSTNSSNSDTIKKYFSQLTRTDVTSLHKKYLLDFEMFDYSVDQYLDLAMDDGQDYGNNGIPDSVETEETSKYSDLAIEQDPGGEEAKFTSVG